MTRIKYDINLMGYISLFESLTLTKLKDCIVNKQIIFIVQENQIAKAIGKNGSNVRRLEKILNKKVKIVEFNPDIIRFIKNFIYPIKPKDINKEDYTITIMGSDTKTKGMLIGRESQNLKILKEIVRRYFKVEDIKVV